MTYKVIITDQANIDLREIYEYIAFELLSPENAAGQLGRLKEHIFSLGVFPRRFKTYKKEPWFSRGLRVMPIDNYLVFYIPNDQNKSVAVMRVMFDGRDIDKQLKDAFHKL